MFNTVTLPSMVRCVHSIAKMRGLAICVQYLLSKTPGGAELHGANLGFNANVASCSTVSYANRISVFSTTCQHCLAVGHKGQSGTSQSSFS